MMIGQDARRASASAGGSQPVAGAPIRTGAPPAGLVERVDLMLPKGTLRVKRRSTCGESSEEGGERLGEPLFRLVRDQRKCGV